MGWTSLTNIDISEGVTTIENSESSIWLNLTCLMIPSSVTFIDSSLFYLCNNLQDIYVPKGLDCRWANDSISSTARVWKYTAGEGKVRLLLEIPDDPDDPNDDWDDWKTQVQRINIGEDTGYVEGIEYRAYKADGTFRVVEKGAKLQEGEKLRAFVAVWTDHFSKYAMIDPEDQENQVNSEISKDEVNENKEQVDKKVGNVNSKKTGENLNDVYFAGLLLSAAILAIYLSLKKRKKA